MELIYVGASSFLTIKTKEEIMQRALNTLYAKWKTPNFKITKQLTCLRGPDLIWVSPSYQKAKPRVVIIGQEQNGFDYSYGEFLKGWTIEKAVDTYREFNFGEQYTKSPFWQFFSEVKTHFFGNNCEEGLKRGIVAWLNLVKFLMPDQSRIVYQAKEVQEQVLSLQDGIFMAELNILQPDICIFVTGPDYDDILKKQYPDISFQNIGLSERRFARLVSEQLPQRSFRTYHPKQLRIQKIWKPVLQTIFANV